MIKKQPGKRWSICSGFGWSIWSGEGWSVCSGEWVVFLLRFQVVILSGFSNYSKLREIIVKGLRLTAIPSAYKKYRWAADQFNLSANTFGLRIIK
jgi:hypothetical protein